MSPSESASDRRQPRVPSAEHRRSGLIYAISAYVLWGILPIYFLSLVPASAWEIVAWRVLFSLVFCAILLTVTRTWRAFGALLRNRRVVFTMGLAGALIYVNWQTYVLATVSGHVVEAALGYFINPIVTVFLGVVVQHEKLRVAQWVAVGVSIVAVVVLAVGYGSLPWIALILAFSFGLYGLIKKRVGGAVDAVSGLTLETMWLTPVAIVQLIVVGVTVGVTIGTRERLAHRRDGRHRSDHRRSAALLRRGVAPAAARLHGLHPVLRPVHPVRGRRGGAARGDAAGALGRVRHRLAGPPHPQRRHDRGRADRAAAASNSTSRPWNDGGIKPPGSAVTIEYPRGDGGGGCSHLRID